MPKDGPVKRSLEPPDQKFAGKVALITGGTRGIGAATARRVAELGANVVITGRREREGQRLVDQIVRNDGSAAFIQTDLTQTDKTQAHRAVRSQDLRTARLRIQQCRNPRRQPGACGSDLEKLRPRFHGKRKSFVPAASR